MKPNFLVIGAAKCATSSICAHLGSHPEAFMCDPKEPFFFSRDSNYVDRGWPWYESLFAGAAGKKAIGEGSVHYTQHAVYPHAAERIARDLPDAKLIYAARHPLRQIESHWMMLRSFWQAVREDGVAVHKDFNTAVVRDPVLLDAARYRSQIDLYRAHYPDERILVLFYEDFRADPHGVLRRCFAFLGIDPDVEIADANRPVNVSKEHHYDRWYFRPARLVPGTRRLRALMPDRLRVAMRPLLRRPVDERPQWTDESRTWIVDRLGADAAAFLARYGKPAEFWDLSR